MKFLLEILGMTNQCNLNCSYCDWEKEKYFPLRDNEILNAKRNISNIKGEVEKNYAEIQLIEYSGGEPFVYPEIIQILLNEFKDKWIRIITNGLALDDEILDKISKHGKVFLAVSLDGHVLEANQARFNGNQALFQKVINNIKRIVDRKIPLMILCTLNKYNIEFFPSYIEYLQENFGNAIEEGLLVMPTHCVTNYSKDNGVPTKEQVEKFSDYIKNKGNKYPVIQRIKEHYYCLIEYMNGNSKPYGCHINEWNICMHFRRNEIIDAGRFLSFGCGMRGVSENGVFDINSKTDLAQMNKIITSETYLQDFRNNNQSNNMKFRHSGYNHLDENCYEKCFVDWTYFDLVMNGNVNYEEAEQWFVLFRDEKVKDFIMRYRK